VAVAESVIEPAVTSAAVVVYDPAQVVDWLTAKGLCAVEQSTDETLSSETSYGNNDIQQAETTTELNCFRV
jgi:hypothetical protein